MAIIDRIIQYSQEHVSYARQELLKTRQALSKNEHSIQDLRGMLQRMKLMRESDLNLNFGSALCDYMDSMIVLHNSQNALATHLSIAMSFLAESLDLIAESRLADVSYFSYFQSIRMIVADIRRILSDYDTKQIPKDGIASAIARMEAIARTMDSSRSAEISEMLRGIRQTIAYY